METKDSQVTICIEPEKQSEPEGKYKLLAKEILEDAKLFFSQVLESVKEPEKLFKQVITNYDFSKLQRLTITTLAIPSALSFVYLTLVGGGGSAIYASSIIGFSALIHLVFILAINYFFGSPALSQNAVLRFFFAYTVCTAPIGCFNFLPGVGHFFSLAAAAASLYLYWNSIKYYFTLNDTGTLILKILLAISLLTSIGSFIFLNQLAKFSSIFPSYFPH